MTVGGNLLDFAGNLSAPATSVTTEKCVFNSVVSTPGARCLLADIKHFYLNNSIPDPEFMRIPLKIIPQEIIDTYDLKQAGIIANQELVKHMNPFGYHPVKHTPGVWAHNSRKTLFSMVVDDFCVQYCSTEYANQF